MSDPVARLNAALEGRYTIERELGEGGMATVYLAKDLKHNRNVALKVLKPELAAVVGAERFLAEIETTANLQHPNILPLYDSGEADGFLFYVMPYIEGETLGDRLERESQLPVDEAVKIAAEIADALEAAHEQGVIHRDIKPANILLSRDRPLVADFGIALAVSAAGGGRLTETGLSLGTPHYMSPEQATGDLTVGPSTDIYALGSVLYEMLVGQPPYTGSSAQVILGKIISGKPVSATEERPAVPANVDAALRKSLEKLPADRFTGASDFARALADPGFRYGEMAGAAGAADGVWRRLSMAMTALAVVSTIALGWVLLGPQAPASPEPVARFSLVTPQGQGLTTPNKSLAISPDGSTLIYTGESHFWLRRLDQLQIAGIPGTAAGRSPVFSPDGASIAFVVNDGLKTISLSGGPPSVVLSSGGSSSFDWGSDGILYFSGDDGAIYRVSALGGGPELLAAPPQGTGFRWMDVLSEGQGLLFTIRPADSPTQSSEIAVLDLEDGEVHKLFSGTMAQYASSGHIVYATWDGTLSGIPFDLGRLEVAGGPVAMIEGVQVNSGSASQFALSENGTLAYAPQGSSSRLAVWYDRTGVSTQARLGFGRYSHPRLSLEDDRLLLQNDVDGISRLESIDLETTASTQIGGEGAGEGVWTPDGARVVFNVLAGGCHPFIQVADGSSAPQRLGEEEAGTQGCPNSISPDEVVLFDAVGAWMRATS